MSMVSKITKIEVSSICCRKGGVLLETPENCCLTIRIEIEDTIPRITKLSGIYHYEDKNVWKKHDGQHAMWYDDNTWLIGNYLGKKSLIKSSSNQMNECPDYNEFIWSKSVPSTSGLVWNPISNIKLSCVGKP